VRLLADDLTGAMDTGARFVGLAGPVRAVWDEAEARRADGSLAFDLGTRESDGATARRRTFEAAVLLGDADIAFLKVDSLLRGHVPAQIASCLGTGRFDHCVIAPAFAAQGRVTRDGRQWAPPRHGCPPEVVGPDLIAALPREGVAVVLRRPGDPAPTGTSLWDAADDSDLRRIVDAGRALDGRVLWCGTAGLAGALAGAPPEPLTDLRSPLLALIGSDHAVTAQQIALAAEWHLPLDPNDPSAHAEISGRLESVRAAAVTVALPEGSARGEAAAHIAATFGRLLATLAKPETLFVTGGETLRSVCEALGATRLVVRGEIAPGIPVSRMTDGRWAGVDVVSKSGAFGDPALLSRLISAARC
jgi:uncharacterized protein YgbK (DUF1537 family)